MGSKDQYQEIFEEHHNPLIAQYPAGDAAQNAWSSPASQRVRFERLVEVIPVEAMSDSVVLDVGCGTGELARYLQELGFAGTYYGIDFNERMIEVANSYTKPLLPNPDAASFSFMKISQFEAAHGPVDYVLASGIFALLFTSANDIDANYHGIVTGTIEVMFRLARRALAFNLLSTHAMVLAPRMAYVPPPYAIYGFIEPFTKFFNLLHDYRDNDMTIQMFHDQQGART